LYIDQKNILAMMRAVRHTAKNDAAVAAALACCTSMAPGLLADDASG
jgi:hypothetical protein